MCTVLYKVALYGFLLASVHAAVAARATRIMEHTSTLQFQCCTDAIFSSENTLEEGDKSLP
jgi:hypothetical protein